MPEPRCPEDHELLPLLDGGKATKEGLAHFNICPACKHRLERLRAEVHSLRRKSGDAGSPGKNG
jgi:hypothetical protein